MLDAERIVRELREPDAAPLHLRLRNAIQAQLLDGTLQPGETIPAERALQEQLGISRATVRQAVKSLVDAGMLKSIVGSGTFVLERPRTQPGKSLVGIMVSDSRYYVYYPDLASSLSSRLREAGYRVDMSVHNDRSETIAETVAGLLSQQVAAVIIVSPNEQYTDGVIRQLRSNGVTVVLLTRYLKNWPDLDYVGVDNERIGYDATQHLLQLGHTGIVHIGGSLSSTAYDRAVGYIKAMQEANLAPQLFYTPEEAGLPVADLTRYVINGEPAQLWTRVARREITAAFCFNDDRASWVQKEIRNFNLVIPRDLSLVSVDNMPYSSFFDAPLTTFALPGQEIGQQTANLLLRRLSGETFPPQRILLPARFIRRLSTAAPPRALALTADSR